MSLDHHRPVPLDGGHQFSTFFRQFPHQCCRALVDEALSEPFMKRIRQSIFYRPRALLPMDWVR